VRWVTGTVAGLQLLIGIVELCIFCLASNAEWGGHIFLILEESVSREYHHAGELMSIPDSRTLFVPVLKVFADDAGHSIEEVRESMKVQFEITPDELIQRYPAGKPIFHVNVALALANLQGAPLGGSKLIEKVGKKGYRITEIGKAYLKQNS